MGSAPATLRVYRTLPLGTPLPARAWARPAKGAETRFNAARAERVRRFFEGPDATLQTAGRGNGALRHTKGRWARVPFILSDWQWRELLAPLFGHEFYDPDLAEWVRLYTLAWLEAGRKIGKSELMAGCGLYLLTADGEEGGEVYSAAGSKEQASFVFNVAARMAELSPILAPPRLRIIRNTKTIIDPESGSIWRVLSADAYRNLGADPSAVLFDEVVSQPNAELWNALRTAFGSRRQPIMIAATTAGPDTRSFAKAESDLSEIVARDPEREPRRFVWIRRAGEERKWNDEAGWREACPAIGEFLSIEALRSEAREAAIDGAKLAAFEVFHLNRWGRGAGKAGISVDVWDRSGTDPDDPERPAWAELPELVRGLDAWGGLDLASSQDIAALGIAVPTGRVVEAAEPEELEEADDDRPAPEAGELEEIALLWRHWIPEAALPDLDRRTAGKAETWVRDGLLEVTPGNVLDYRAVLLGLQETAELVNLREVAFDRWGAMPFMSAAKSELAGLRVVPFGQGFRDMGSAWREFRRLMMGEAFVHGDHPLARWQIENVRVRIDPAGGEKPDKERSIDKIDGIVSVTMGVGRAMLRRRSSGPRATFATFGG